MENFVIKSSEYFPISELETILRNWRNLKIYSSQLYGIAVRLFVLSFKM